MQYIASSYDVTNTEQCDILLVLMIQPIQKNKTIHYIASWYDVTRSEKCTILLVDVTHTEQCTILLVVMM